MLSLLRINIWNYDRRSSSSVWIKSFFTILIDCWFSPQLSTLPLTVYILDLQFLSNICFLPVKVLSHAGDPEVQVLTRGERTCRPLTRKTPSVLKRRRNLSDDGRNIWKITRTSPQLTRLNPWTSCSFLRLTCTRFKVTLSKVVVTKVSRTNTFVCIANYRVPGL